MTGMVGPSEVAADSPAEGDRVVGEKKDKKEHSSLYKKLKAKLLFFKLMKRKKGKRNLDVSGGRRDDGGGDAHCHVCGDATVEGNKKDEVDAVDDDDAKRRRSSKRKSQVKIVGNVSEEIGGDSLVAMVEVSDVDRSGVDAEEEESKEEEEEEEKEEGVPEGGEKDDEADKEEDEAEKGGDDVVEQGGGEQEEEGKEEEGKEDEGMKDDEAKKESGDFAKEDNVEEDGGVTKEGAEEEKEGGDEVEAESNLSGEELAEKREGQEEEVEGEGDNSEEEDEKSTPAEEASEEGDKDASAPAVSEGEEAKEGGDEKKKEVDDFSSDAAAAADTDDGKEEAEAQSKAEPEARAKAEIVNPHLKSVKEAAKWLSEMDAKTRELNEKNKVVHKGEAKASVKEKAKALEGGGSMAASTGLDGGDEAGSGGKRSSMTRSFSKLMGGRYKFYNKRGSSSSKADVTAVGAAVKA